MTERDLLWPILADPSDDLPRLAMADHWDEQGQGERAELVRIQCALAARAGEVCSSCRPGQHTNGPCRCPRDLRDLRRRERELLAIPVTSRPDGDVNCAEGWSGGTTATQWGIAAFNHLTRTELLYGDRLKWEWRRGFVASVALTLADWQEHRPAIVACQPVTEVRLIDKKPASLQGEVIWQDGERLVDQPYRLPSALFRLLGDGWPLGSAQRVYANTRLAHAALSRAALLWARHAACAADPPLVPPAVAEAWDVTREGAAR